jgi:hypothetical protein
VRRGSEVHATAHVATRRGGSGLLGLVGDDGLGGEEEAGDAGGVLQRRAGHLGGVDDAGPDQVDVLTRGGVEALTALEVPHLLDDDATLEAGVDGDLLERGLERDLDDVRTRRLVALDLELLEGGLGRLEQGDATTGDDALLDGGLGVADGVLDAVLALLELDLEGDEATGANIVRVALEAPLKQIAVNAGLEGGVVAEKVRNSDTGWGLNAASGEYVDLVANGIIDPAKVTRSALQNAASIAALFLTTEAVIADKPEKAAPAMPGGDGGMGGMDF